MVYIPRGSEFRVNSQTFATQDAPDVAVLTNGGFVVTWEDQSGTLGDSSELSIKAQIYNGTGAAVGGEFLVNTQTRNRQIAPTVTGLSGDRFVITWTDANPIGDASIKAQIFDSTGTRIGSEFLVNTQAAGNQAWSTVSRLTNDGFVITWFDEPDTRIYAQVYDSSGVRVGAELAVSTNPTGTQNFPVVAGLSGGGFVVAWEDQGNTLGDSSNSGITAQFYDAAGAKIGGEFLVNTTTFGPQQQVDIAMLSGGRFVMTWTDGNTFDIKAQMFDATRARIGGEFLVNAETLFGQGDPSIAAQADGGFVIAWTDNSNGSGDTSIKAQAFDASGAMVGAEFQVNTNTFLNQVQPSAAPLPDGSFVVVWTDHSFTLGDNSNSSVKAQLYQQAEFPTSSDFNSDGKSDVLWRDTNGFVAEWQMNGAQTVSNKGVATPGNDWKFQDTGDFGGDGVSDVLWRNVSGQVVLWQMNNNKVMLNTSIQTVSNDYHIQGVADFNGDGKSDVLWRHDSGQVILWQMDRDKVTSNTAIAAPSRDYHIEGVGDFGGDGKSDVLFRHDSGQVVLWQMDGDKIATNTAVGEVSQQYHVQGVGDFNHDGNSDILWRHDSGQVVLWQMDGDKVLSNTAIAVVSNDYKIQDVRDYNGDGMDDVLFRHVSGQVVLWQMNGDQIVSNSAIQTVGNNWTIQAHHFDLV